MKNIVSFSVINIKPILKYFLVKDIHTNITYLNVLYNKQCKIFFVSTFIFCLPTFYSILLLSSVKSISNTYIKLIKSTTNSFRFSYQLKIEINGTGYRFYYLNQYLYCILGFSHLIKIKLPFTCIVTVGNTSKLLVLQHTNKYIVGNLFYIIQSFKNINIYKGKGIKNIYSQLKLKLGKTKNIRK